MSNPQEPQQAEVGVSLGVDGGTTSTTCICIPCVPHSNPDIVPVLGRAVTGCVSHICVGEVKARVDLEKVLKDALLDSGSTTYDVRAVCVCIAGVNDLSDQFLVYNWLREIFPSTQEIHVHNDVVAALCSGTMGKLHGCVLYSGMGSMTYGCTEDEREMILGNWGSRHGIPAQALKAFLNAHDGHGPSTMLTSRLLEKFSVTTPDEIIGWAYEDPGWGRVAAFVPIVVSCAEAGDKVAIEILDGAVMDLVACVKDVISGLNMCGQDGATPCPVVLIGTLLESDNQERDIAKEVMDLVNQDYPGAYPVRPMVESAVGAALLALHRLRKGSEG